MQLSRHMRRNAARSGEQGYILLILLLTVALMIIAAGIILPSITFDIKRDREEELIHRGVQYSRAIKIYYKKFGRYPSKIEDLESTNNLRFLRKRFKDPMNCKGGTCKDFKLLHFGEVTMSGGLGGLVQGATPVSAMSSNGSNGPGGLGSGSSFGSSFGNSSPGNSSFGNSSLGGNSSSFMSSNSSSQTGQNQTGQDQQSGGTASGNNSTDSSAQGANGSNGTSAGEGTGQTFGGAPIVGVVSAIKDETIREFNHKHKYSEWQFIYDPGTDRGGLLMTPNQPQLFGGQQNLNGNQQNGNGTNGQQNGPGTGFGTGSGFSLSNPSNNNGLNSNQNSPQTNQPAPSSPNPQSPQQ